MWATLTQQYTHTHHMRTVNVTSTHYYTIILYTVTNTLTCTPAVHTSICNKYYLLEEKQDHISMNSEPHPETQRPSHKHTDHTHIPITPPQNTLTPPTAI
ncbi:hypothetical protein FKM82_029674 [Ascaphus truei]